MRYEGWVLGLRKGREGTRTICYGGGIYRKEREGGGIYRKEREGAGTICYGGV